MSTILEIGLFVAGLVFAICWFAVTILPLVYGFPRSATWAARGWVRWRAPLRYLAVPIIWNFLFFLITLGLVLFLPDVAAYLMQSWGVAFGQMVGLAIAIGRLVFAKSAREDIRADFLDAIRPYLTPDGLVTVGESVPKKQLIEEVGTPPTFHDGKNDWGAVEKIVQDFGSVTEDMDSFSFYDVSRLPHEKEKILHSLLTAFRETRDPTIRHHIEFALMLLPQFQEGVGDEPIATLPAALKDITEASVKDETSAAQTAEEVIHAASAVDQEKLAPLRQKAKQEAETYRQKLGEIWRLQVEEISDS